MRDDWLVKNDFKTLNGFNYWYYAASQLAWLTKENHGWHLTAIGVILVDWKGDETPFLISPEAEI